VIIGTLAVTAVASLAHTRYQEVRANNAGAEQRDESEHR
jgi:hypothetical protein